MANKRKTYRNPKTGHFISKEEFQAYKKLNTQAKKDKIPKHSPKKRANLTLKNAEKENFFGKWEKEVIPAIEPRYPRPLTLYKWSFRGPNSKIRTEALLLRLAVVNYDLSGESEPIRVRVIVRFRESGTSSHPKRLDPLEARVWLRKLEERYSGEVSGITVYAYSYTPKTVERQPSWPRKLSGQGSISKPMGGSPSRGKRKSKSKRFVQRSISPPEMGINFTEKYSRGI